MVMVTLVVLLYNQVQTPERALTYRRHGRVRWSTTGRESELRLCPSDSSLPAAGPKAFDSKLEERFAKDFEHAAPHSSG
jgi:hypothetical protein